ncbi:hypothetical protein LTR37_014404 [Vermiconidia calcicola]|uniref:Uncharacterized protein n=1 Tax=Vermiconidia calcicola TaxID=1690605 RepID=A0ACC3MTS1_9PEZI|nr:hypothetical protein LTR37_014404 [Vermiconidia calcicola]
MRNRKKQQGAIRLEKKRDRQAHIDARIDAAQHNVLRQQDHKKILFDLPRELRNSIYALALNIDREKPIEPLVPRTHPLRRYHWPRTLEALTLVSRQGRLEAMDTFFARSWFLVVAGKGEYWQFRADIIDICKGLEDQLLPRRYKSLCDEGERPASSRRAWI